MPPPRRRPTDLLPLTPAMLHVLLSLAEADKHGYAILKEVEARTNGAVQLSTGTLYGLVKRLLADGLIAVSLRRPADGVEDDRRRAYRLTEFGRQVAAAEAERLERIVQTARSRRLLRRSEA
jgi:DNA-binding PadR family transcriptional regulator